VKLISWPPKLKSGTKFLISNWWIGSTCMVLSPIAHWQLARP
jgi:hypothetical protein